MLNSNRSGDLFVIYNQLDINGDLLNLKTYTILLTMLSDIHLPVNTTDVQRTKTVLFNQNTNIC